MQGMAERAGTVQLREEKAQGDLINVYEYLKEGYKEDGAKFFSVIPNDRARGKRHKLIRRRFSLNIRENILL